MPTRARVQEFVSMVERGEFLESFRFYADDATAQENNEAPRVGLAALVANEKAVLARCAFDHIRAESFTVDGDHVAIHWIFDMTLRDGGRVRLDEISYQEWRDDKIVRERFFYDPAQRRTRLTPET